MTTETAEQDLNATLKRRLDSLNASQQQQNQSPDAETEPVSKRIKIESEQTYNDDNQHMTSNENGNAHHQATMSAPSASTSKVNVEELSFPTYEIRAYPQYDNYSPFMSYPGYPGKKKKKKRQKESTSPIFHHHHHHLN
jgi:hypothetical protein